MNRSRVKDTVKVLPSNSPSIEQKIEDKFTGLVIPKDPDNIELKDVTGGENFGIVTETEILANLPSLTGSEVYKAWLEKDGKAILLGNLTEAKGGFVLNLKISNYNNFDKVFITAGTKRILEGSL